MNDNNQKFRLYKSSDKIKLEEFDQPSIIKKNLLKIKNENMRLRNNLLNKDSEISILKSQICKIKSNINNYGKKELSESAYQLPVPIKTDCDNMLNEANFVKENKKININSRNSLDISKLHLNFNSFQGKGFYEYKNHNNLNVVKGNNIEELNNLNDVKLKYKEITTNLNELDKIDFNNLNNHIRHKGSLSRQYESASNIKVSELLNSNQNFKLVKKLNIPFSPPLVKNSRPTTNNKLNQTHQVTDDNYNFISANKTFNDCLNEVDNIKLNFKINPSTSVNANSYKKINQMKLPKITSHETSNVSQINEIIRTKEAELEKNHQYNIKESSQNVTTESSNAVKNPKYVVRFEKPYEKSKSEHFNNLANNNNNDLKEEKVEFRTNQNNTSVSKSNLEKECEDVESNLQGQSVNFNSLNNAKSSNNLSTKYYKKINDELKEENTKLAKLLKESNSKLSELNNKYINLVNEMSKLKVDSKNKIDALMKTLEIATTNFSRLQKIISSQNEMLKMGKETKSQNQSKLKLFNLL